MNKKEHAKNLIEQGLERLSLALEAGESGCLRAYLETLARFPNYSFRNVMLIASQRPDASRVAGFRTWKKLGRFVKKGEKGIVIVAPMPIPPKDDSQDPALHFRAVHVFDVSQTDGDPLPEPPTAAGDPAHHTEAIKLLIKERGIALEFADYLGGAQGLSAGGTIKILCGLPPAEEFSTLVHELAHEILHHGISVRPSKRVRETEAEAVAFTVSSAIGLDADAAASDYIQLYQGDAKTLAASLERIQEAANVILTGLLGTAEKLAA